MFSDRPTTGRRRAVFTVFAVVLLVASCSVKEVREDCPCALYIKLESLPAGPVDVLVTGEGFRQEIRVMHDTVLLVRPPKSGAAVRAIAGASADEEGRVRIPFGYDCPPVYLFDAQIDTALDTAAVEVLLHKHFCNLSLAFDGPPGWGEPYWTEIRGPVDGLLWDGTPLEGSFSCRLDDGLNIRLPRQQPEQPLLLDITMPDRVVRTFDLGYYLEQAGYDWTEADLEDRTLEIDLSVTALTLRIDNWTARIPMEIII